LRLLAGALAAATVLLAGSAVVRGSKERLLGRLAPWAPEHQADSSRTTCPRTDEPWRRLAPALVVVAGGTVGWALLGGPPGAATGIAVGAAAPAMMRRRQERRRADRLEEQLIEACIGMGAAVRSGMSLAQALGYAAEEVGEPLGPTLRDVARAHDLGLPLDQAVERWGSRLGGDDATFVAAALRLHRSIGGNLPTVLEQAAATLRERRATTREVRSLTAQARLSGAILVLLPVGFFLFLSVTSPHDMGAAYRTPAGLAAIATGGALDGLAFLWIRRLLRVET
jgi:tight adherence protein B